MIGKIFQKGSGSFRNRIEYILGLSKHEHTTNNIKLIGKNCFASDPLRNGYRKDEIQAEALIEEFDAIEKIRNLSLDSDRIIKPVWHAILSLRPGESLTQESWLTAVEAYLNDLGFGLENKWIAVLHEDTDHPHVHIVANRICINDTFSLVKDNNERLRSCDSVSHIEDRFLLPKAPPPEKTWGASISRAQVEASNNESSLPWKRRLIAKIAGAVEVCQEENGDMFLLIQLLRCQSVHVHFSTDSRGHPTGIAYEHQGIIISGRRLKRSRLTFQKLILQERIRYDPKTFSDLAVEAAKRDEERQNEVRILYIAIRAKNGRPRYVSVAAKNTKEAEIIIRIILSLILALLGIRVNFEIEDRRETEYYHPIHYDWLTTQEADKRRKVINIFKGEPESELTLN